MDGAPKTIGLGEDSMADSPSVVFDVHAFRIVWQLIESAGMCCAATQYCSAWCSWRFAPPWYDSVGNGVPTASLPSIRSEMSKASRSWSPRTGLLLSKLSQRCCDVTQFGKW